VHLQEAIDAWFANLICHLIQALPGGDRSDRLFFPAVLVQGRLSMDEFLLMCVRKVRRLGNLEDKFPPGAGKI
jgi:hypothetical protein